MSRSLKKGPYCQECLMKKVEKDVTNEVRQWIKENNIKKLGF